MPDLDAVLFDIDDTLFSTSEFAEKARRNAIQGMILHGLRIHPEEALRELREVISEFSSNHSSHFDNLLLRFPPSRYHGVNPAVLVAAGVIAYHETKSDELNPFPDVPEVLRQLSRTHLILGVVSQGLKIKQAEKLLRLGVYPFFHPEAIFISDQIGIGKPNPKIYLHACNTLGLDPTRVMYVGDNPEHDIDPCNKLGMVTVRNRRGTRYAQVEGKSKADYEIQSFHELADLLRSDFGLVLDALPDSGPAPRIPSPPPQPGL